MIDSIETSTHVMSASSLLPTSLAALPEFPSLGESVLFQLNGLIVVFIALGSIWGMLELMGLFFRRSKPAPATTQPAPAPTSPRAAPSASDSAANELPPELLAAISAAIHVALAGRAHRITAIVPAAIDSEHWAREGRRSIFASRKTR